MIIVGIDPGLDGAITFLDTEAAVVAVYDMPTLSIERHRKLRREVSPHLLTEIFAENPKVTMAYLEQVGSRPGESAVGAFTFGRGVGVLEGVLAALGVPYVVVAPSIWKKKLKINAGKDANRQRAMHLWPDQSGNFKRVKDDGRADASLIAFYGSLEMKA